MGKDLRLKVIFPEDTVQTEGQLLGSLHRVSGGCQVEKDTGSGIGGEIVVVNGDQEVVRERIQQLMGEMDGIVDFLE